MKQLTHIQKTQYRNHSHRMKKNHIQPAWAWGLVLSGMLTIASCGGESAPQSAGNPMQMAVPVTVTAVSEETLTGYRQFPANVVPLQETELRAEVSGYITGIFVADGASVQAGQKLYEVDHVRYAAAAEQAEANLKIIEANRDRVKRDLARYEALAEKDAIARQVLDNARTELQTVEAQLIGAQAALTTAQTNLNRAVIRAPFSGVVGISQVRTGALVSAGSTLLNTISSTSPIAVEFQVNESDLGHVLEMLNRRTSAQGDSTITLELSGGEIYPHYGRITTLDRAINRNTGTITVRATFANPEGRLRAGMSTIMRIKQQAGEKQLVIPYKAVSEQLGQTTVYVLGDSSRVEQRVIRLGMKSGELTAVTEGLSLGEQVVTEGMINLRHGALVQTDNASQ